MTVARDHARIQIDIWNDADFRGLSPSAQFLYFQLLTSATLTYAGVADWRPKRIAALSSGRSASDVEEAMSELEAGLFVVVDEETEEAFVRSFFKWDGLLQKPNVAKAMIREWGNVHSLDLKAVIVHELKRLRSQFPEWRAFEAGVVDHLLEKGSMSPDEMVERRVPGRVSERVPERDAALPTPYSLLPAPNSGTPNSMLPAPAALAHLPSHPQFESVWESWPKKTEKDRSEKEYLKHVRSVDDLAEKIARFGRAYAATTEKQFIPSLAAWLHQKRWTDELPTAPSAGTQPLSRADEAQSFIQRLEAIDATRGSGEAAGNHQELR